jgi:hypothetical protein
VCNWKVGAEAELAETTQTVQHLLPVAWLLLQGTSLHDSRETHASLRIVLGMLTPFLCSDLDMHDLIIAVDIGVRDDIMRMVASESPAEQDAYGHKVSTFLVSFLFLVFDPSSLLS